jgi:hypothetical protein
MRNVSMQTVEDYDRVQEFQAAVCPRFAIYFFIAFVQSTQDN